MARRTRLHEAPNLHRADDDQPGIRRLRAGRGFTYRTPDGGTVGEKTRDRIKRLAIPPARIDVWICPSSDGHLQATGRDAARAQAVPLPRRLAGGVSSPSLGALATFGEALGRIRRQRNRDLADVSLEPAPVTAGVVMLLERTMVRVGNEEYVKANGHYGLTTLRSQHVRIGRDGVLQFRFVGKSGVVHRIDVDEPRPRRARPPVPAPVRRPPLPVRRRRWAGAPGDVADGEPLPPRRRGRRCHGQGLPHLDGDTVRGTRSPGSGRRRRAPR